MDRDLILQQAEAHFRENGDSIKFSTKEVPNATYEVIRGGLTGYAYSRLKDWQDAEDAMMEAYTRILEQNRYEGVNFGGLYKVILDAVIVDMFRKDAVREHIQEEEYHDPNHEGMSIVELAEGDEVDPERVLEIQEKVNWIMSKSNRMPQKSKGIIRMSIIFGYTNAEIAKILNIKPQKVANVLDYFRKKLNKWEDDEN